MYNPNPNNQGHIRSQATHPLQLHLTLPLSLQISNADLKIIVVARCIRRNYPQDAVSSLEPPIGRPTPSNQPPNQRLVSIQVQLYRNHDPVPLYNYDTVSS